MAVRRAAVAAVVAGVAFAAAGLAHGRGHADVRVTVFGDSAATAVAYDPDAKRILGRGIDLRLEVAACRRVGDTSCPYDGVRPPNVIERATQLGRELGPVVVVLVGYNDYESRYAQNIEDAMAAFRKAGVERVLWATLRAERQSYLSMNEAIVAAARRFPQMTVLDWNALAKGHDDWVQPDGIHLTPQGAQAMATMVNDALVQLGVAPKPAPPKLRPPLAIASHVLPVGHRGKAYAGVLHATGGFAPYRWTRIGGTLAPGLRLAANGRFTGIPRRNGTFTVRTRVVDRAGAARVRVFLLRIL
jgi:hypothetical protein